MQKRAILKLNASFFPLCTCTWEDTLINIFSGAAHPLDIFYGQKEDGSIDTSIVEGFNVIKNWNEWMNLPVRSCDDTVMTTQGAVRLPSVVIAARYNRIKYKNVQFPTKQNIFRRDKYTCGYTGKKLQKHELSVDHILPISRGGENSWTNLITCSKEVNNFKDNRLPQECGLKLLWTPEKPNNGVESIVFNDMREDWNIFLSIVK